MMTLERFDALQRSQLKIWMAVTDEAVSGVNRLIGLNLQAIKAGFGETEHCLHKAVGAQGVGEWWNTQARYLQPAGERVSGYMHNFVEIGVGTQSGIARVLQHHSDEVRHQWGFVAENFVDAVPSGVEAAVSFFRASVGLEVATAKVTEEAGASRILVSSNVGALDITTH